VRLVTYHCALVINLSNLDWYRLIISIFEFEAQPHNSIPYVHTGLRIVLYEYMRTLFSSERGEWLPIIHFISLALRSSCFRLAVTWAFQVRRLSKWIPRYLTDST